LNVLIQLGNDAWKYTKMFLVRISWIINVILISLVIYALTLVL
jgi:hypothetical protein